jgi:hypothetical protein
MGQVETNSFGPRLNKHSILNYACITPHFSSSVQLEKKHLGLGATQQLTSLTRLSQLKTSLN